MRVRVPSGAFYERGPSGPEDYGGCGRPVKSSLCDSEERGFESRQPPFKNFMFDCQADVVYSCKAMIAINQNPTAAEGGLRHGTTGVSSRAAFGSSHAASGQGLNSFARRANSRRLGAQPMVPTLEECL